MAEVLQFRKPRTYGTDDMPHGAILVVDSAIAHESIFRKGIFVIIRKTTPSVCAVIAPNGKYAAVATRDIPRGTRFRRVVRSELDRTASDAALVIMYGYVALEDHAYVVSGRATGWKLLWSAITLLVTGTATVELRRGKNSRSSIKEDSNIT